MFDTYETVMQSEEAKDSRNLQKEEEVKSNLVQGDVNAAHKKLEGDGAKFPTITTIKGDSIVNRSPEHQDVVAGAKTVADKSQSEKENVSKSKLSEKDQSEQGGSKIDDEASNHSEKSDSDETSEDKMESEKGNTELKLKPKKQLEMKKSNNDDKL